MKNKTLGLMLSMIIICHATSVFGASSSSECIITGCNRELCIKQSARNCAVSTCIWKAQYTCYQKYGICEADNNDACGWRQTTELTSCLKSADDEVLAADPFPD